MILFISNSWSCFLAKCFCIHPIDFLFVLFFCLFVCFFLCQPHRNRGVKGGYQILPQQEIQTQVIRALSTIITYPPRSNVPWCPTPELLGQTRFLTILSGSYGYDRNYCFQVKMIINIRNKLPSSCLGSLHNKLNW